jgi:hypothetical protein
VFDRKVYFDSVRDSIFDGYMTQAQVDGQEALLSAWEKRPISYDLRWLAYMLATTFHETAATMQPIEEFGRGEGHDYGEPDPTTGQCYFGRGYVQLTWADNYKRATSELGLSGTEHDIYWHPQHALDPVIAGRVMSAGMEEGWFTGHKLLDYFSAEQDDPCGARQIINPDDKGELIADYHKSFLSALQLAETTLSPALGSEEITIRITIDAPPGVKVIVEQVEN